MIFVERTHTEGGGSLVRIQKPIQNKPKMLLGKSTSIERFIINYHEFIIDKQKFEQAT